MRKNKFSPSLNGISATKLPPLTVVSRHSDPSRKNIQFLQYSCFLIIFVTMVIYVLICFSSFRRLSIRERQLAYSCTAFLELEMFIIAETVVFFDDKEQGVNLEEIICPQTFLHVLYL